MPVTFTSPSVYIGELKLQATCAFRIMCKHIAANTCYISQDVDLITNWSDEWQLGLSIGKCNTLLIGKQYDDTQYYIDGVELLTSL